MIKACSWEYFWNHTSDLVLSNTSHTWWWMVFGCQMDSCREMRGSRWSFSLLFILELARFSHSLTLRCFIILCYYTYSVYVNSTYYVTCQEKVVLVFLFQRKHFPQKSIIGCIRNVRFNNVPIGAPAVNHGGAPCFDGLVEKGVYFAGADSHMILGMDLSFRLI